MTLYFDNGYTAEFMNTAFCVYDSYGDEYGVMDWDELKEWMISKQAKVEIIDDGSDNRTFDDLSEADLTDLLLDTFIILETQKKMCKRQNLISLRKQLLSEISASEHQLQKIQKAFLSYFDKPAQDRLMQILSKKYQRLYEQFP